MYAILKNIISEMHLSPFQ